MTVRKGVYVVWKNLGETPLECIARLRATDSLLEHEPITYAGRLDPLAEGLLLLLVGDERLRKNDYIALSKVYEFEILWGFASDTHDALGIAQFKGVAPENLGQKLHTIIKSFIGKRFQKYPVFSSKPVHGRPLFQWAREGRLDEIEIPVKKIEITAFEVLSMREITKVMLQGEVKMRINSVKGDFRQDECAESWERAIETSQQSLFCVSICRVSASSGTYVRGIVDALGKEMGIGAVALRIVRTKIGNFTEVQKTL